MYVYVTRKMIGKMTGFRSINTSALTNPFCRKMAKTDTICSHCYSRKMECLYGATRENNRSGRVLQWVRNGKILSRRLLKDSEIPHFQSRRPVRFHAHGELFNTTHLFNLIAIAEANPAVTFALWSKRLDLTKGNLKQLDNLFYVYSIPKLNKLHGKLPTGFHKVFAVLTKDYVNERNLGQMANCGKHCAKCMLCYTKNDITHIYELLK